MRRRVALTTSLLCAVALMAAAATPASATTPNGKGLVDFGPFTCEGLGEVSVFGPRGPKAASAFTSSGEHINLLSLEITGTAGGDPVDFSKTYGQKRGLTAFTCTQHFEDGQDIVDVTAVVAIVPPQ